jgi:hypothetical protein
MYISLKENTSILFYSILFYSILFYSTRGQIKTYIPSPAHPSQQVIFYQFDFVRWIILMWWLLNVNHVLDSGRPPNLNPPASCSGRLFWSKDPLGELRGCGWVCVRGSKYLLHLPLLSPALWLVAGLSGPTPSIANHLPTREKDHGWQI